MTGVQTCALPIWILRRGAQTGRLTHVQEIPARPGRRAAWPPWVPADLAAALAAHPIEKARFEKLSYSHQRRHVMAIEAAKAPETRARRIEGALKILREG